MDIKNGYNKYSEENDKNNILLDVGVLKLEKGSEYLFKNNHKEKAILILSGKVEIYESNDQSKIVLSRKSIWEESPMALHGSKNHTFNIKALENSEMILQAKTNDNSFEYKLYDQRNCKIGVSGDNYEPSTSTRYVIDIFNYSNAPYSNMVLGEVFTKSGHWSGYPPHKHEQPEIYIYKFNKDQGFGVGIVGEKAKIVNNYDPIFIPGNEDHQNACAPGYQMYFVWMISHLPNNPWTNKRKYDLNHEWINQNDLKIKDTKEIK